MSCVRRLRLILAAAAVLLVAVVVAAFAAAGPDPSSAPASAGDAEIVDVPRARAVEPDVGAPVAAEAEPSFGEPPPDPEAHLAQAPAGSAASEVSPGAPSDTEVKAELKEIQGSGNGRAQVLVNGEAVAPQGAPLVVKQLIAAGNAIALKPYLWGGGHGRLYDVGYDCSGSLSFAFFHAGLMDRSIVSGGFSSMGDPGPGRWISVYSNAGHVFMVVAGLRFDTSAIHLAGSRWTAQPRSTAGFVVRHLRGL